MRSNDNVPWPVPIDIALGIMRECEKRLATFPEKDVRSFAARIIPLAIERLGEYLEKQASLGAEDVLFTYEEFCRKHDSTTGPSRFVSGVHETSLKVMKDARGRVNGGTKELNGAEFYIALGVIENNLKDRNPAIGLRWVDVMRRQIKRRKVNKPRGGTPNKTYSQTLVGLWTYAPQQQNDDVPFQDFDTKKAFNNPLAYLWASSGSKIWYEYPREDGNHNEDDVGELRVYFANRPHGAPANIAIHPTGLVPRERLLQQRYLTFECREFCGVPASDEEENVDETKSIGIALRVRDANLIQWEFKMGESRLLEPVEANWKKYSVKLEYDLERPHWHEFFPLGIAPGDQPDFSVITTIVFEVGRSEAFHRPGPGSGCIEFRHIFLTSESPSDD